MEERRRKHRKLLALHQELEQVTSSLEKHITEAQLLMAENRQLMAGLKANPIRRLLGFVARVFRKQ